MSETLTVILPINQKNPPEPTEKSLNKLGWAVKDTLELILKSEAGNIKPPELTDKKGWLLGRYQPDEVIKVAKNWKQNAIGLLRRAETNLEEMCKKHGVVSGPKLSEMIQALTETKNNMSVEETYDFELNMYGLRHAVCALGNRILYGYHHVVIPEPEDTFPEVLTMIPKGMMDDICTHPENYAVIKLYYD